MRRKCFKFSLVLKSRQCKRSSIGFFALRLFRHLHKLMPLLPKEVGMMLRRTWKETRCQVIDGKGRIICYYYHETGHTRKLCMKLQNCSHRASTTNVKVTLVYPHNILRWLIVGWASFALSLSGKDLAPMVALVESDNNCLTSYITSGWLTGVSQITWQGILNILQFSISQSVVAWNNNWWVNLCCCRIWNS